MPSSNLPARTRRVAVATSDGVQIDQHLGQATGFLIYDVEPTGKFDFVERRASSGPVKVDPHVWSSVSAILEDVDLVLAARAGRGASQVLAEHGILAVAVTGPVEQALIACGRRGWLLERGPVRRGPPQSEGCSCDERGGSQTN
jgi:predicted Fe-Mo cluster-binding NifX family protein